MIKTRIWLALLLLTLLLSACGDQAALDQAQADRIRQETAQRTAAQATAEARAQTDWESTHQAKNVARQVFILLVVTAAGLALAIGLALLLLRLWQMSGALTDAFAIYSRERAKLAGRVLKLDRETRTFPVLVIGDAVHNLETAEVYPLAELKPADPGQVSASAQVRALGLSAQAAERIAQATQDPRAADAVPFIAPSEPRRRAPGDALIVIQNPDERIDL